MKIVVIVGDFNDVMQKTTRTRMDGTIIELGIRGKDSEPLHSSNNIVWDTLFKKMVNYQVTYESGPFKANIDYCLVKRKQMEFLEYTKVLPNKEYILQHMP